MAGYSDRVLPQRDASGQFGVLVQRAVPPVGSATLVQAIEEVDVSFLRDGYLRHKCVQEDDEDVTASWRLVGDQECTGNVKETNERADTRKADDAMNRGGGEGEKKRNVGDKRKRKKKVRK